MDTRSIANDDVQAGRAGITIAETSRPLHHYVPLYMGFKTPMVACNQDQNESLVFIRFLYNLLSESEAVVTDGNARTTATKFRVYTGIKDLDFLDVKAIESGFFFRPWHTGSVQIGEL